MATFLADMSKVSVTAYGIRGAKQTFWYYIYLGDLFCGEEKDEPHVILWEIILNIVEFKFRTFNNMFFQ